jgi:hypothetical protein
MQENNNTNAHEKSNNTNVRRTKERTHKTLGKR